jgi:hypothetical protein
MVTLGKCSPVRRQEKYVGLLQFNPSTARNKSDISHLGRGEWRTNHTNGNISHNSQLYSHILHVIYRDRLMRGFFWSVLTYTSTYSRRKLKVQAVYIHMENNMFYCFIDFNTFSTVSLVYSRHINGQTLGRYTITGTPYIYRLFFSLHQLVGC